MPTFKASVQYGDWEGTAAADNGDQKSLEQYLTDKGLIKEGEFLVAASLWVGENHDGEIGGVYVHAYIYAGGEELEKVAAAIERTTGPIPVREVDLELKLEKFVSLFKRFSVMFTWRGLSLEGREYEIVSDD
ncbi:MAG TPA: hypothetical protein VE778_05705 [Candidatus Bathyarchaeia archaeon]|jgi:hypothetical protein|nr:hypothetical protein [Candidatus Bathyarchaeia archaeon]